jgi:hypothetical protein
VRTGGGARRSSGGAAGLARLVLALTVAPSVLAAEHGLVPPVVPTPADGHALVRFVHVAPSTLAKQVILTSDDLAVGDLSLAEFASVSYRDATDYLLIPAGGYGIAVRLAGERDADEDATMTAPQTLRFEGDGRYTIALLGLPLLGASREEERGDGFLAWLQSLVAVDRGDVGERLAPRLVVLDDDAEDQPGHRGALVRIVHAAPGTGALVLAFLPAGEDGRGAAAIATVEYGQVSEVAAVDAATGAIQIRFEGSSAVAFDLAEHDLAPGTVHTFFVTGTPVAEVPLGVVVVSTSGSVGAGRGAEPSH